MSLWIVLLVFCSLSLAQGQVFDRLYNKLERILGNGAKNTIPMNANVSMAMSLIQVTSLDPVSGDAEFDVWLNYEWNDGRLSWDPDDFGGVHSIRMLSSEFWNPDIRLYNGHLKTEVLNSVISSDGTVFMMPPTTIKTRCGTSNYNSDGMMTCYFKFGSWTYDGSLLDLRLRSGEGVDMLDFRADRWDVVYNTVQKNVKVYTCCPESYPDVTFTLEFRDTQKESGSSSWNIFS